MNKILLAAIFIFSNAFLVFSQTTHGITEPNYQTEPGLTRTIDQSKPVHGMPAQVDVSNGSASYSIPINVPPGINGHTPSISIGYNSSSGNGLLGYAWHLNASSAITRTVNNHLFDGRVTPVNIYNSDKIALDGQRLILYSGTQLASGSKYRTAVESFQDISKTTDGFTVTQKDGIKRYYGISTDSRLEVTIGGTSRSTTEVVTWLLEKVEDRNGNVILYDYEIDASKNEYRLNEILYAGVDGTNNNAVVEFHYSNRIDSRESYANGKLFNSSVLLKKIRTTYNGNEYSRFEFNYSYRTGIASSDFSRLAEIDYYGKGTEVNSTLIKWYSEPGSGIFEQDVDLDLNIHNSWITAIPIPASPFNIRDEESQKIPVDLNGDGKTDILSLEYTKVNNGDCWVGLEKKTIYSHRFEVFANIRNSSGFTRTSIVPSFTSNWKPDECERTAFCKIYTGDFNGDGLSDFILQRSQASSVNEYHLDFYINQASAPGSFALQFTERITNHLYYGFEEADGETSPMKVPFALTIADFDADGIDDYAYLGSNTATTVDKTRNYDVYWNIKYINPDGTRQHVHMDVQGSTDGLGSIYASHLGDFNGDGKVDILFLYSNNVYSSIVYSTSRTAWHYLVHNSGFPTSYHYVRIADFNGDGLSDILANSHSTTTAFEIHYFDGTQFLNWPAGVPGHQINYSISTENDVGNKPGPLAHRPYPILVDIDKDTRTDVIFFKANGNDREFVVHYNKITGWDVQTISIPSNLTPDNVFQERQQDLLLGDYDGSGDVQILYNIRTYDDNSAQVADFEWRYKFRPNDESQYVHQILDGFNRLTEFEYDELTNPSRYSRSIYSYPNPSLIGGIKVVKSIKQKDFQQNVFVNTSYTYQDLRLNLLGLGFLGYGSMTVADNIQGISSTSTSDLVSGSSGNSWPFLPNGSTASLNGGGSISSSEILYKSTVKQTFPNSNFNFKPQVDRVKKKDLVHNTSEVQENTTYDNFGNVLQQTHTVYNNQNYTAPYLQQESTTSTYRDEGSWVDWQPEDVTVTSTRYGETPVSVTSNYFYQSQTGNLTEERFQYGTEAQVVTTYQYFTEGNLQTQTVTPQNMASRVSSYTYTTDRRFVKTKTNPLGWVTEYNYDHTLGVVTSETDNENNLQTSFAHDDFGRVILTTYPDGNTESVNRVWDLATTFGQSLFYAETTGSNQPSAQKWYDGQVREIRSKHKNRNDDWVFVRTIYDSKGRVWKKSLPYLSGGSMNYSVNTYDAYGRPLTKTSPNGTSVSYAYSGRTTTTTNTSTNQSTSKTTDATGEVISATDDGGTITYHYNSWGKPRQIDGPASSTIITYDDESGRQTTLNDPAAGLMQYQYNAAGELTRQEDAAGNVFAMTYDKLGRITTKSGPEGNYSFSYDTDFIGKIDSRTSPDGVTCSYQYDHLGRTASYTEHIDGINYEFNYSYDASGNLLNLSYPNGFVAEHNYDSYAYLTDIRNANDQSLIWQYINENEMGQTTVYQLGETPIYKAYDPLSGLPQEHFNATGTFSYSYDFSNQTGNLSTRTDLINSLNETFEYDNLDRLTGYTTSLGNTITTDFSSTGDISQKTDVGTYLNDVPTGRTGEIENNPGTISNMFQTITYTPFHSVRSIMEGDFDASFEYGPDDQRRKMIITQAGAPYRERVYVAGGLYERDFYNGQWRNLAYIKTPTGQEAVVITDEDTQDQSIYYLNRDYLGSIISIVDENGGIIEEYSYDVWGNRRNPQTWENQYNPGQNTNLWNGLLSRGFTGHEHLDCFGLINMNGRLYDPLLGRMLSPDNFVQNASFSPNFNRYAYAYNNPLTYTDPDGEIIFAALAGWLYFSESGYEVQKYISPVAIHANVHLSPEQVGLGFDVSVGVPKGISLSYRTHAGATYYLKHYDESYDGWETRRGGEWTFGGWLHYSGTTFSSGEISQTTNMIC